MTSIFKGQPPQNKAKIPSNQNKGPHLGSRYIFFLHPRTAGEDEAAIMSCRETLAGEMLSASAAGWTSRDEQLGDSMLGFV